MGLLQIRGWTDFPSSFARLRVHLRWQAEARAIAAAKQRRAREKDFAANGHEGAQVAFI
jgi:hypothetical protein